MLTKKTEKNAAGALSLRAEHLFFFRLCFLFCVVRCEKNTKLSHEDGLTRTTADECSVTEHQLLRKTRQVEAQSVFFVVVSVIIDALHGHIFADRGRGTEAEKIIKTN